jgi:ABC-2 type transport system permease protein
MRDSLRVIGEIIKKEFFQIRQDKRMLMISIVAPVLQVLLLGYAATTDITNSTMVVCDMDNTEESRTFVRRFTTSGYFVDRYSVDRPGEIDRYIEHGEATIALIIPKDFGRKLLERKSAPVQVILDGTDANSSNILLGYATQIIASYSQSVVASVSGPPGGLRVARVLPEPRIWFNPDLKSQFFMVPGVIALVLMMITTTLTALGIVREKESGTLEQLMVTPIKPYQLILGKLIPFTLIGFVDILFVLSVARFWFGIPIRGSIPLLFGLSGLFILTTLGLGLLVSTIARSQQQAMLIAQFFFMFPFMLLGGFAFPIANMPQGIQVITTIIPLRYFLVIVRGIFLKGSGLAELWVQAVPLLIIGVSILVLSVLRFHKKLE